EAYPRALVVRRGPGHGAPLRDADPGVPHPEAVNQPFGWYVPERDAESLPPAGSGKRQATATLRRTLSRAVLRVPPDPAVAGRVACAGLRAPRPAALPVRGRSPAFTGRHAPRLGPHRHRRQGER